MIALWAEECKDKIVGTDGMRRRKNSEKGTQYSIFDHTTENANIVDTQSPVRDDMTPVINAMRREIHRRHYSIRTERSYEAWVVRYIKHPGYDIRMC